MRQVEHCCARGEPWGMRKQKVLIFKQFPIEDTRDSGALCGSVRLALVSGDSLKTEIKWRFYWLSSKKMSFPTIVGFLVRGELILRAAVGWRRGRRSRRTQISLDFRNHIRLRFSLAQSSSSILILLTLKDSSPWTSWRELARKETGTRRDWVPF